MDRQLISSGAAFEERVGYSRAVRVGQPVWVSGTAPIMPGDADPPDDAYEQARICLGIIERALAEAGASLDDVVRTRIYVTSAEDIDEVGRAHREAFGDAHVPATTGDRHRAARPALARRDRGRGRYRHHERRSFARHASPASVLEHRFGSGDPYTLGVEEEYMLLDPETWDLVQHIDSMLARVGRRRVRGAHQPRADAVGARDHDAGLPDPGRGRRRTCARCARYVGEIARKEGCRFASAGTHPFSLFERQRITAKDRYRLLVDQLQYIARSELIFGMHVHAAVDDPDKAIAVVNGLLVHLPQFLALSASSPFWRGEPTGLRPRGRWCSPRSRARAFRRGSRATRSSQRSIGQLERTGCIADYTHIWWDVRAAPAPRHGRAAGLRRGHARRGRGRARGVLPGAREDLQRAVSTAAGVPSFHRILTTENKWLAARYGLRRR